MPNSTFFNLPEPKRQKIIDLAIAEFASRDYDSASISNVVKQAKIAKGSFYQYFADKKDLYLYLVELAMQQKIAFLKAAHPPQPQMGFFPHLRWLFSASTQFDLSHPALSQIVNRAMYGDVPFREDVLQRTQFASSGYLYDLIKGGIEQGDINASVSPDLALFVINGLSSGLRDFIPQQLGLDTEQLAQGTPPELDMTAIEKIFDDLVQVLEQGLGQPLSPT
ncbi:MAG: TetR/AcrR family transcriptional regulator [Leptolyngbya sp. RL_3_1]|nr:TetR/AcrR family transcriptional regulator [Leptolyngbya sp. RL_3_1]